MLAHFMASQLVSVSLIWCVPALCGAEASCSSADAVRSSKCGASRRSSESGREGGLSYGLTALCRRGPFAGTTALTGMMPHPAAPPPSLFGKGREAGTVAVETLRGLNGSAAAQPPSASETSLHMLLEHTPKPWPNWQQVSCTLPSWSLIRVIDTDGNPTEHSYRILVSLPKATPRLSDRICTPISLP